MAFSTVDNMTIYLVPLLPRMAVRSHTHPGPLAQAGLGVLAVARSEGVQPIAPLGAIGPIRRLAALGLGPFGCVVHKPALDQPDACISLGRFSVTPLERFRLDPRYATCRAAATALLNSDLKSGHPRIDKTQSPPSVDHLRVLCGRRRSSNLVARRRSRDKLDCYRRYSC